MPNGMYNIALKVHNTVYLIKVGTGIFVLLKNCLSTKVFSKFLSYGINFLSYKGQKFSEKFYQPILLDVLGWVTKFHTVNTKEYTFLAPTHRKQTCVLSPSPPGEQLLPL